MNRSAAIAYLTTEFGSSTAPYLALAGVELVDSGPVGGIVDAALLRSGVAYADLPTATVDNALAFRAVLRYEALIWLWNNLNDLTRSAKVGAGQGITVDATAWRQELPAKIALARIDARAQGVDLPETSATNGWGALNPTAGRLGFGLDYLEQEPING